MSHYQLEEDGFTILPRVLEEATIIHLLTEIQRVREEQTTLKNSPVYALRNLFQVLPSVRQLAASPLARSLVEPYLGTDCVAVRAIYFDKIPSANWKVPYHQDLSIALASQHEVEGFGPWSHKEGVLHALAPNFVLEQMLTIRFHLNDCSKENGALRVLPGSHRHGRLEAKRIEELKAETEEVFCEVEQGGVLLMRPLLLHASSPSQSPNHRHVIHIEYAGKCLPQGLEWHEEIQ